jgi:hypothetical protein
MSSIEGVSRRSTPDVRAKEAVQKQADVATVGDKVTVSGQQANQYVSLSQAISSVRITSEMIGRVERVVKSFQGVVEQREKEPQAHRKERLEKEASSLLSALGNEYSIKSEKIKIQAEEVLGESLDLILPDLTVDKLGLASVSLKDTILEIRKKVDQALGAINDAREELATVEKNVRDLVVKSEVARENKEASNASLRDLDSAFGQSSKVAKSIIKQGLNALDAVQEVKNPLSLLS